MPKVYIHIGPAKTGSTSIQYTMFHNRRVLLDHGIRYFSRPNTILPSVEIAAIFSDGVADHVESRLISGIYEFADLKADLNGLLREVISQANFNKLIISSEALAEISESDALMMKDFFDGFNLDVKIIGYARHPYYAISSKHQNWVIGGNIKPLNRLQFRELFEKYINVFGRDAVRIQEFSSDKFAGGHLMTDFFHAIDEQDFDMEKIEIHTRNISVSTEAIAILEALNPFFHPRPGQQVAEDTRASSIRNFFMQIPGRRYAVSPDVARRYYRNSEPDIQWLRSVIGYEIFPEPENETAGEQAGPDWGEEVLVVLGRKMNGILLENQQLRARVQFLQAGLAQNKGNLEKARELYIRSVRLDPSSKAALNGLKSVTKK